MPRYILTGTPGAGKTAILRQLELNRHLVVEEAATDVIARENALGHVEPWHEAAFIDKIVTLQGADKPAPRRQTVPRSSVTVHRYAHWL
jgi:predicted ATPase